MSDFIEGHSEINMVNDYGLNRFSKIEDPVEEIKLESLMKSHTKMLENQMIKESAT